MQMVKLIAAPGAKDNGRRTILKAMAAKQRIDSQIAEDILDGRFDRKIHVPAYLRSTLQDIGLGGVMAPLKLFEIQGPADEPLLMAGTHWDDIEFEVALD